MKLYFNKLPVTRVFHILYISRKVLKVQRASVPCTHNQQAASWRLTCDFVTFKNLVRKLQNLDRQYHGSGSITILCEILMS